MSGSWEIYTLRASRRAATPTGLMGRRSPQVFDEMYSACRFRNGYPEPLLTAHIHIYITPPVMAQLQAHTGSNPGMVISRHGM